MSSPKFRMSIAALRRARGAIARGRLRVLPLLLLLPLGHASAQLMVHPTRIVLEGEQRSAQLEIINNTNQPATYQLSVVNRRMDENGGFSDIDIAAAGERFAGEMLRYSPRRINLAPGAGQVVRIMARKPADLPAGEYRSHLLFAQQLRAPTASAGDGEPGGDFSVSLIPLVGVSIPVIVRNGETAATVSLGNVALTRDAAAGSAVASLDMHRAGNQSVYGDLVFNFAPAGGSPREIGRASGVAVYTPNAQRHVALPLTPPAGMTMTNGTLTVEYRARRDEGGGLLAQASLVLP